MLEILYSGGWVMVPILLCSVAALAIILERSWALREVQVMPKDLLAQIQRWVGGEAMNPQRLEV